MEARRRPASIACRVGTLAEVIADLTGLLGNRLKREIPELNIIA